MKVFREYDGQIAFECKCGHLELYSKQGMTPETVIECTKCGAKVPFAQVQKFANKEIK